MSKIELLITKKINRLGLAVCLKPKIPQVFTPTLAHEIRLFQNRLAEKFYKQSHSTVYYIIWYLYSGKIPWQGLDFNFILNNLKNKKETAIINYIEELFDLLFLNYIGLGYPIINCSLATRDLSGLSQDFFCLNQINFFKLYPSIVNPLKNKKSFDIFHLENHPIINGCFPSEIYLRNQFYNCYHFNFSQMKKILSGWQYTALSNQELETIKSVFEKIKTDTVAMIFKYAEYKMQVIKKMAHRQFFN